MHIMQNGTGWGKHSPNSAYINIRARFGRVVFPPGASNLLFNMPTSTTPYEVIFDFSNDINEPHTLQVENGATVLLHPRESISLVLNAGLAYKYTARWNGRIMSLAIRIWRDTQLKSSDVFSARFQNNYWDASWSPKEGVTVRTNMVGRA